MFRCGICDNNFDSDLYPMEKIDDIDVCEDCYLEQKYEMVEDGK